MAVVLFCRWISQKMPPLQASERSNPFHSSRVYKGWWIRHLQQGHCLNHTKQCLCLHAVNSYPPEGFLPWHQNDRYLQWWSDLPVQAKVSFFKSTWLGNGARFEIRWNFFATSHGKGVGDGIGGTLKRAVWRREGWKSLCNESQQMYRSRETTLPKYLHWIFV